MIYKNKRQSQNLSLYKQRDPSLFEIFSDYDKHKKKKKAGIYFRIKKKEEKQRPLPEKHFFSAYFLKNPLFQSYFTSYKVVDGGIIEITGPRGLSIILSGVKSYTKSMQSGSFYAKEDALNKGLRKSVLQEKKGKSLECKFHEDLLSFSTRSRRIVGYTSYGDLFTKHF